MACDLGKEKFAWLLNGVGKEVLQHLLYSKIFEKILREINIKDLLQSSDVGELYGVADNYHWKNLESLDLSSLALIIKKTKMGIQVTKNDTKKSLFRIIKDDIIPKMLQRLIGEILTSHKRKGSRLERMSVLDKMITIDRKKIETLDISDLCEIIRTVFHVNPSKEPPEKEDKNEEDDVYRIQEYRNKLAHDVSFDISTAWDEMPDAILRLGQYRPIFRNKIKYVKEQLSLDEAKKFAERTLNDWVKSDQQTSIAIADFKKSQNKQLQSQRSEIMKQMQKSEENITTAINESEQKMEIHLSNAMKKFEERIKVASNREKICKFFQEMKLKVRDTSQSNFKEMKTQIEMEMNVQRKVLATTSDIKKSIDDFSSEFASKAELSAMSKSTKEILEKVSTPSPLCCLWDLENPENLKIVIISGQEYKNIVEEFKKAEIPHNDVLQVVRIQNIALYQQYEARKSQILKMNPPGFHSERFLWHRPKYSRIEEINVNGFSESNCGEKNDIAYGNGVPFLVKPMQYPFPENIDTEGNQTIYLCSVLTGEFTKGTSHLNLPPRKPDSEAGVCFDSVVDNADDPNIFVIFHDSQAYPHYLLTFK